MNECTHFWEVIQYCKQLYYVDHFKTSYDKQNESSQYSNYQSFFMPE